MDKLLPYQIPHLLQLQECLSIRNRVLDASDTGTGKTYVALALCKELNLEPFIICPKAVVSVWNDTCKIFNVKCFGISNYEMLKNCRYYTSNFEKTECPYMDKIIKDDSKIAEFKFYLPDNVIIIFDEAHRCKNISSQTSKLLQGFSECKNKIMLLSATLIDKIQCFTPFGIFFGFYSNTKHFRIWMKKEMMMRKLKKDPVYHGLTDELKQLKIIHDKIFPNYGSRMKVKELIEAKLFPETQILADCYYLENHIEIDKLFHEINTLVLEYAAKALVAEQLARLIYCRQRIEMLKMPIFFDLIEDGLSNGFSIVIFVNYLNSLNHILYHMADKLKNNYNSGISLIMGGQSIEDRKHNIDEFQSNKTKLIIVMSQAGGVGLSLHDIHNTNPRMSIISPTWSGDQTKQILGRVHRANGSRSIQKIVFVAKTYEEEICKLIKNKLQVIDAINDGDLMGPKIPKNNLELDGLTKIDEKQEVELINKFIKGEIKDPSVNDNTSIETRLEKIKKKKSKKSKQVAEEHL